MKGRPSSEERARRIADVRQWIDEGLRPGEIEARAVEQWECLPRAARSYLKAARQADGAGSGSKTKPLRLPRFDPAAPGRWMVQVNARLIRAVAKNPGDAQLQATARTISTLMSAARGYINTGELEEVAQQLMDRVAAMERAREHGQAVTSAEILRNQSEDRPGAPVH